MDLKESLDTYRQAVTVADMSGDTPFRAEAKELVETLGKSEWDYPVECLLCRESFMLRATLEVINDWMGKPRGVCGKHGDPEVVVVT